jgi:translation elongation factor aEF-1 beta
MSENSHIGIAGVKIKIMPESPNVDLLEIEHKVKSIVEAEGGRNNLYSIEPIAFGLKALIAFFQWPEDKHLEKIEEEIKALDKVQSVQITDIRKIA